MNPTADEVELRTQLRPGDLGWIVHRHGILYAREYGFDATFEAYVAGPLSQFARTATPRKRIWRAEHAGRFLGCVDIVPATPEIAQLRWFLVSRRRAASASVVDSCISASALARQVKYRR